MSWLENRKTYIVAILGAVAAACHLLGIVDQNTLLAIDAVLAPLGLAFLRAGVSKAAAGNGK